LPNQSCAIPIEIAVERRVFVFGGGCRSRKAWDYYEVSGRVLLGLDPDRALDRL
jgi:hypothetical protein